MASLRERVQQDTTAALKAGDKARLGVLRMVSAAFKQQEIDRREAVSDEAAGAILQKMIKQRRDAAEQFRQGGRDELADKELAEIGVIEPYLPAPLEAAELAALIDAAIAETAASSPKEMGRVMAILKPKIAGRADMGAVSTRVRTALGG